MVCLPAVHNPCQRAKDRALPRHQPSVGAALVLGRCLASSSDWPALACRTRRQGCRPHECDRPGIRRGGPPRAVWIVLLQVISDRLRDRAAHRSSRCRACDEGGSARHAESARGERTATEQGEARPPLSGGSAKKSAQPSRACAIKPPRHEQRDNRLRVGNSNKEPPAPFSAQAVGQHGRSTIEFGRHHRARPTACHGHRPRSRVPPRRGAEPVPRHPRQQGPVCVARLPRHNASVQANPRRTQG